MATSENRNADISIEEWLTAGCKPKSAIPDLTSKLTPELAATTILDAVFARGRFRGWYKKPRAFDNGGVHWSEVEGVEDLVYDWVEEEEVWEQVDDMDHFIYGREEAESRAVDYIMGERYEEAQRQISDFGSAKDKTLARSRAMALLTAWLETPEAAEPDQNTRKQIQRKAMRLFPLAVQKTMNWFSKKNSHKIKGEQKTRISVLKELTENACRGDDEPFQEAVFRELCVFLVVHGLFVDLRTLTSEAEDPEDLRLPIWAMMSKKEAYDECWWHNCGQCLNRGNKPTQKYTNNTYGYVDVWSYAIKHVGDHPLGLEASLGSIEALVAFLLIDTDIYESQITDVEKCILPELKKLLGDSYVSDEPPDEQTRISDLLQKATARRIGRSDKMNTVCRILSQSASQPLNPVEDPMKTLSDCAHRIETLQKGDDGACHDVKSMRLSGNHSKEYLLNAAFTCPSIEILDLEDCTHLDEEILQGMTNVCGRATTVLLRGTTILESSPIVMKLRCEGRIVDF